MQKLIIAIVSNEDSTAASRALTKGGFSVTRLATTGGFLLSGNTTMLVGTDAERVEEAIHIIGENSCKRNKMVAGNPARGAAAAPSGDSGAGRRPAYPRPVHGGAQSRPAAGYRHFAGGGAAVP